MPEAIRNYVSPVNRLGNFWGEQDYDFPKRSTNGASCATSPCRIYRFPVAHEIRTDVSDVEHFVPKAKLHEALDNALFTLVVQQSDTEGENVINLECSPIEGSERSAGRMVFLEVFSPWDEYIDDAIKVTEIEKECREFCDSHGLTEVVQTCLKHAQRIFAQRVDISAEYDVFEEDAPDDTGHVVVRVKIQAGRTAARQQYDAWLDWFIENVDDANRNLITLTVRRV